jgi:hypothetical protein
MVSVGVKKYTFVGLCERGGEEINYRWSMVYVIWDMVYGNINIMTLWDMGYGLWAMVLYT